MLPRWRLRSAVDIQFERDCWFALTGAACEAMLDGEPVWVGWRMAAKAGQHLVLKTPQYGIRSYLAVAGGIDVPEVLGSRCTDLKVGIGGLEGRRLQDGDRLKLGKASRRFSTSRGVKSLPIGNRIRALPGPEYHEFDRPRKGRSGVPRSLAPRATGWDIVCRANRLRAPPIAKCFRTACCRGGTGSA